VLALVIKVVFQHILIQNLTFCYYQMIKQITSNGNVPLLYWMNDPALSEIHLLYGLNFWTPRKFNDQKQTQKYFLSLRTRAYFFTGLKCSNMRAFR